MTLREVPRDHRPFRQEGLGWRYEPPGVPVVFRLSKFKQRQDELTCEVQVLRPDGQHVMRRRVNLMSGITRGSLGDLVKDLTELMDIEWKPIVRTAAESAIEAERAGSPTVVIQGKLVTPQPVAWLCDGLVLKGKPNCWLGAGSTGKSTLAKMLCVHYGAGRPFMGRRIEQGRSLYLDWEDDQESFERVAHDVCQHLGVPVPWLAYKSMMGKRLADMLEEIGEEIDQYGIGLLVLDAISPASGAWGEHSSWESMAMDLEAAIKALPQISVLGIDHVNADDHRNGKARIPIKARGAERKYEMFRNQWSLVADETQRRYRRHVVNWHHTKINAGTYYPRFTVEIIHGQNELSVVDRDIETSPEAIERLDWIDRYVLHIGQHPGKTAKEIALEVKESSAKSDVDNVRIQLQRRAERHGDITADSEGRWWSTDPALQIQAAEEDAQPEPQELSWWSGTDG